VGELFSNDDGSCDILLALTGKITGTTGMQEHDADNAEQCRQEDIREHELQK